MPPAPLVWKCGCEAAKWRGVSEKCGCQVVKWRCVSENRPPRRRGPEAPRRLRSFKNRLWRLKNRSREAPEAQKSLLGRSGGGPGGLRRPKKGQKWPKMLVFQGFGAPWEWGRNLGVGLREANGPVWGPWGETLEGGT